MVDCDSAKQNFFVQIPYEKCVLQAPMAIPFSPIVGKGLWVWAEPPVMAWFYEKGKIVGKSKMSQVTVGFQVGGQAYRELIFFETKEAMDRFKSNKIEPLSTGFSCAATKGASQMQSIRTGIMIYTQQKGGLCTKHRGWTEI
jgi:lipid-binding SYLF domain-containing protein